MGFVLLPEGLLVPTVISTDVLDSLRIGMDMEMVLEKIKEDDEGNDVMVFKFRPVSSP